MTDGSDQSLQRSVELVNQRGLHARASAAFIKEASQFEADVRVAFDGEEVGTASVMDLMMLGARVGATIEITATGPDASDAMDAVCDLVARRFDEAE